MNLLKKIGILFLMSTVLAGACPDKNIHKSVEEYLKESSSITVKDKKIVINTQLFVLEVLVTAGADEKKAEEMAMALIVAMMYYSENHNYQLNYIDAEDGKEKAFTDLIDDAE